MSTGPLNLSDADIRGFDALDAGGYIAEVFDITMDAVKNTSGEGKMPAGTPMVKVQYKLLRSRDGVTEGINNRRVFQSFVIPPKDYDKEKASKLKGMLAKFFMACGEPEEAVLSKNFDPDFDNYKGQEVFVTIGKEPKKTRDGSIIDGEFNNPVKGVKPVPEGVEAGTGGGLL